MPNKRPTSSEPTTNQHAPTDPRTLVDEHAIERADYHVARLGNALGLSHHRREDLRQDLLLELCRAAHRYDPTKSSPRTFVSRVLSRAAAHQARCIRNERKNGARTPILLSQLQREGRGFAPIAPRWCEPSVLDHAIDLERGLAALSREEQQLAAALKTQLPREIAAERGVHRSTVYRDIATMRENLAEFDLDPSS